MVRNGKKVQGWVGKARQCNGGVGNTVGVLEEKSAQQGQEKSSSGGWVSAAEKERKCIAPVCRSVCVKFEGCKGKKAVICRVNGHF